MMVRIFDDVKASVANAIATLRDKAAPDRLEFTIALCAYYRYLSPGRQLLATATHFRHAYKNVEVSSDQAAYAAVLMGPPEGKIQVAHLRAQPFRSTRAPGNWGRFTSTIQWILLTYMDIYTPVYVEDCFVAKLAGAIGCASPCLSTVIKLLGPDSGKTRSHRITIDLYGGTVSILQSGVFATLPPDKRWELDAQLPDFLRAGALTASHSAKLRGAPRYPTWVDVWEIWPRPSTAVF